MDRRGQDSEIAHRADLRPPSIPSLGYGEPKRIIPTEPNIDKLWRTMGAVISCQWFDRDVQYVTFWFDLAEGFANDYRPEEEGESFSIKLTAPDKSFGLTTTLGPMHMAKVCFVHERSFYLRTNLPEKLLELLKQVDENGAPTVPLTLELRRRSKPGPTVRRLGSKREFRIAKATGPVGF